MLPDRVHWMCVKFYIQIQQNFNGSNTFRSIKLCSRHGYFELMSITQCARRHNIDFFCVYALESPHRCDSNDYTEYTIFNIKQKISRNYFKYNNGFSYRFFCWGLKNKFEIAVVNEPSVFEPLKFY